jgi:ammonia channel protein AmtB
MSVLPVETSGTRVLNTLLLFLVALEPYLFNNLGDFFIGVQQLGSLQNVASTVYALDIGTIYAILAMFTNILATEERKLVAPDLLRKFKFSRNLEIIVAVLFLVSAIPEFWTLNLRYSIWATTFFVFRGGSIVKGRRKRSHSS